MDYNLLALLGSWSQESMPHFHCFMAFFCKKFEFRDELTYGGTGIRGGEFDHSFGGTTTECALKLQERRT